MFSSLSSKQIWDNILLDNMKTHGMHNWCGDIILGVYELQLVQTFSESFNDSTYVYENRYQLQRDNSRIHSELALSSLAV